MDNNTTINNKPKSPLDPISNLETHLKYVQEVNPKKKKKNYEIEFDFIEEKSTIPNKDWNKYYSNALTKENDPKNRYPDVLALDNTRVILPVDPEYEQGCTDYINANFIMNYDGNAAGYISTQGPTDITIRDFWRMVWKHNVHVLVMLTKEYENGTPKSCRYWPPVDALNSKVTYHNFQITVISIERDTLVSEDIIIRKFILKNIKEDKERTIVHFQYTGWPDHGLPPSSQWPHFVHLMGLVDNAIAENGGPICIHCSAGIGRTGTFCTIHINIHLMRSWFEKYGKAPQLSIVATILRLRKQRAGMVQTKEQFLFCYQIITQEYKRLSQEYKDKKLLLQANNNNNTAITVSPENSTPTSPDPSNPSNSDPNTINASTAQTTDNTQNVTPNNSTLPTSSNITTSTNTDNDVLMNDS